MFPVAFYPLRLDKYNVFMESSNPFSKKLRTRGFRINMRIMVIHAFTVYV